MARATLSVFEHQSLRVGERVRADDGTDYEVTESLIAALARYADTRRERLVEVGYRRVTFRQFVGFLQVGDLGIEILPKADRDRDAGTPAQWHNAMLKMLDEVGDLELAQGLSSQAVAHHGLLELLVASLAYECEALLERGLAKGYREVERNGAVFKGRLTMGLHLRANLVHADRFFVRFDSYELDTLLNRLLHAALSFAARLPISPRRRASLAQLLLRWPELASGSVTALDFDRVKLGRTTEQYRRALALARLLLEHRPPTLRHGEQAVFGLLFDMNRLWESYVARLVRRALAAECDVTTQSSRTFWSAPSGSPRHLRPDLVIRRRSDGLTLIADTKWKLPGAAGPTDDDLRQVFAYNERFQAARSLLIYPSAGVSVPHYGAQFHGKAHACDVVGLGQSKGDTLDSRATMKSIEAWLRGE